MRHLFFITIAFSMLCGCIHATKPLPAQAVIKDTTQTSTPVLISQPKDTIVLNKTIETIAFDLNNDGKEDTIRLSQDTASMTPGFDVFNRIALFLSGHKSQSIKANDMWDAVDTSFLNRNKNAVLSKRLYIYKDSTQAVILLFGYIYGAGREEFSVIHIKNGKATMVFDKQMDYPEELRDLDNDGVLEIVGKSHSEVYDVTDKAFIETYDPYYVYSINNSCKLNYALTQKYNEENYVWAGLHPLGEIKVRSPKDGGKPSIVK